MRTLLAFSLVAVLALAGCSKTRPPDQYLGALAEGAAAYKKSDWAAADKNFAEAAEMAARTPVTAETWGTNMTLRGVKAMAPALSQSIDVWTIALGPEHPTVLSGLMQMAYIYYLNGNYKLGDAAVERALKAYKHSAKPLPHDAETWLGFLPQLLSSQGERDRAEKTYAKIIAAHTQVLGKNSATVARCQLDQADYFARNRLYGQALKIADEALQKDMGANAQEQAYALKKVAWINAQSGRFNTAEQFYLKRLEILKGDPEAARKAEAELCAFYEEYGGFDEAARRREHIYKDLQAHGAKPDLVDSAAHDLIGVWQNRYPDKAAALAASTQDDYDKNLGSASPEAAHILHHQAYCQAALGHLEKGRTASNWGLALLAWDAQGHVRNVIADLSRFADRLSSVGRNDQALKALDKGLQLARESKEQEEWGVQESPEAAALKRKADWMRVHGTTAQAVKAYDEAVAVIRKDKKKDDIGVAQYLLYQCETALERADYQSALTAAAGCETIYSEWMGDKSARRARILALKARAAAGLKNTQQLQQTEQEARVILERQKDEDPYDCCEAWLDLGKLCLEGNRLSDAQACFQKVIDLKKKNGTRGDLPLARALDGQAQVAERSNNVKEAIKLSREAMTNLKQVCFKTPYVVALASHHLELSKRGGSQQETSEARVLARQWAMEMYGPEHAATRDLLKL